MCPSPSNAGKQEVKDPKGAPTQHLTVVVAQRCKRPHNHRGPAHRDLPTMQAFGRAMDVHQVGVDGTKTLWDGAASAVPPLPKKGTRLKPRHRCERDACGAFGNG